MHWLFLLKQNFISDSKCINRKDEWSLTVVSDNPLIKSLFVCYAYKSTKEYPLGHLSIVLINVKLNSNATVVQ